MSIKTILLVTAGFLCLALGGVGVLLPVWPTTPFVLVAVSCFAGAPRLQAQICKIPFFKQHIENYKNRTGLSHKMLAGSLVFLWGMLGLSMILVRNEWVLLLLAAVGTAVTVHLLCIARARRRDTACTDAPPTLEPK